MKDLRNCPDCGYRNGFHVSFTGGGDDINIGLICPMCGEHFDLEWVREAMQKLTEGEESAK